MRAKTHPVALTVAGSDSGGNAGVMADLRAFRDFRVHGCVAFAALTAQNPHGVRAIHPVLPGFILAQLSAVLEDYAVGAAKTGMLFNAPAIRAAAAVFGEVKFPVVVDPVMVATSGARLLQPAAVHALEDALLPLAFLVTPNVPEAEILSGTQIADLDSAAVAAELIARRFGCSVLVKGGHLLTTKQHESSDSEAQGYRGRASGPSRAAGVSSSGRASGPSRAAGVSSSGRASGPSRAALSCGAFAEHRTNRSFSTDVLFSAGAFHFISAPSVPHPVSTHGTGCTLSAAIAANLARGATLRTAVQSAKDYVTAAIARSYPVGPHAGVLA